jgi:homoserine kinase
MRKLRVFSPATSANLGSGFDVFGLALREPYDVMDFEVIDSGVIIESNGYPIPVQPEENCAGYVALEMINQYSITEGVKISIQKNIKPASGLGSSAASGAGAAHAIDKLFDLNLTLTDMVAHASRGEILSAGVPHCDNVVANLFGGFTVTVSYAPLEIIKIPPPQNLGVVIALPNVDKGSTEYARRVIPKSIPMKKLAYNVGHAALLAAGVSLGELEYIKKGMDDGVVEPARARAGILKEFFALKKLGKNLNVGIAASGAGPAIISLMEKERRVEVGDALVGFFEEKGYRCDTIITEPGSGTHSTSLSTQIRPTESGA